MTVGEKIRFYREFRGMTQLQLAQASGIPFGTIRKYEINNRNPKPEQKKKIADALQVSPNLFLDMKISTKGEVADLLFRLDESVDMKLVEHDDGKISLEFSNTNINNFLNEWIEVKKAAEKIENNITSETSESDKELALTTISQLNDTFYNHSVSSNFIVEKGTHGLKVKLRYD